MTSVAALISIPPLYVYYRSRPTVGVALIGPKHADRLSSSVGTIADYDKVTSMFVQVLCV